MINKDVKKVLVIGSGPIVIGQAAEFDYAGTQACRSLREEGVEVVLVNSNPSTIMTDVDIADRVYIEPITLPFVTEVIKKERPDALLATLGGQVGLNMAVQLSDAGVLDQYGVKLLGSSLHAIKHAEDRELFKAAMEEIHQPVPESEIFEELEPAIAFADKIGYPVIIRPAYTLGGTGGGIAHDRYEMEEIANRGIKLSPINQILVERSIAGWKEVEFEVMRDSADNCIIVCAMENIDPVGVHTGDSIVVAPTQTLTDGQYQMLRTASLDIIRYLKIEGGCNVQYGLDTKTNQYYVIEVNPRASRTVPFMSKITGINMVEYATRIALGESLKDTGLPLGLVPDKGYVAIKAPVFSFSKLGLVEIKLGPEMKSTGEVMGIGHTYQEALYKAVVAAHLTVPAGGNVLITVSDRDKPETAELAKGFVELGYHLICTSGTGAYFEKLGIPVEIIKKIHEKGENCEKYLKSGRVDMLVNTISYGSQIEQEGYDLRRIAVELAIPCITSLDTAKEVLRVMAASSSEPHVEAIQDYVKEN